MLLQEYRSNGENQELKSRNLLILQFIKLYIQLNNIVVAMVVWVILALYAQTIVIYALKLIENY